ncbi:MAG: LytTR family DNA-binding domain-containing protein [Bacteroidetes bacterium]|nr:LytTR family DNA-binding domain-containing protein [Bacteroidota bacterium]
MFFNQPNLISKWLLSSASICPPWKLFNKSLIICLVTLLFFLILQPFDTQYSFSFPSLLILAGLALVIGLSFFLLDLVFYLIFTQLLIWEALVWRITSLCLISIAVSYYDYLITGKILAVPSVLEVCFKLSLIYVLISIYPGILRLFINRIKSQSMDDFSQYFRDLPIGKKEQLIQIPSDNRNESVNLPLIDLIYIKAMENYLEVFYKLDNRYHRKIVINTLKEVEKYLSATPICRIHRSYLVNLLHLRFARGNSHGLKIGLNGNDTLLTVSRSYVKPFRQKLAMFGQVLST